MECSKLKTIAENADPLIDSVRLALDIVKEFIIEHGLILYGGMAIDGALRLKGEKLYADGTTPDYDFYSPNNINHAYDIAERLYKAGLEDARAIVGTHPTTMRVDVSDKRHWIADISYRSEEIFNKLPYLTYNGMKIIHPIYQRLDIHIAFSFPYIDPPREAIFNRWEKDSKRFALMANLYPIEKIKPKKMEKMSVPIKYLKYVLSGFAAFSILQNTYDIVKGIDGLEFVFPTIDGLEICHFKPKNAFDLDEKYEHYEPYGNLMPERYESVDKQIRILNTENNYIVVDSKEINFQNEKIIVRIVGEQYLLYRFLSSWFMYNIMDYLYYYQAILNNLSKPSIDVYGSSNISLSLYIQQNDIKKPNNYYPGRLNKRPNGDINQYIYFQEDGKLIK